MRIAAILALGPILAPLQDPPRLTLEKSIPFADAAAELGKKSGEKLAVDPAIEAKTLDLKIRDAGFFEALDALCRAHGDVTYLEEEDNILLDTLNLHPGAWTEYPTSYSGPFKLAVVSFTRIRMSSVTGNRTWVRANFCLFWPPSFSVTSADEDHAWRVTSALDSDGHEVQSPADSSEPFEAVRVHTGLDFKHATSHSVHLREFDPVRGLKRLEGKVAVEVSRPLAVQVPIEVGSKVETPEGKLSVTAVSQVKKAENNSAVWAVSLKFEPREAKEQAVRRLFEPRGRLDDAPEEYVSLPFSDDLEFDVRLANGGLKPKVLHLTVRAGMKKVEVPFSFKDVVFKGK